MNLNAYSPEIIIGACVVVLVVMLLIACGVHLQRSRRRTEDLRRHFGPVYETALAYYGSRRRAEAALESRLHRAARFDVRPLSPTQRARFLSEWDTVQARFVDHPRGAVVEADELINAILVARGYPGTTFEQRSSDLSVHYPRLIDSYRRANSIAITAGKNEATTEELRTAMIHYRALFEELVQTKTIEMRRAEAA
ncbi:hypothetical protein [Occallatibacter riparius]|uniref:Uncharacterized protein n=1 Tax=Occallatibacter riparius TaxID=1002689 RepID=A0A9J7BLL2_9BACT|nr:hypothetical protein [Occallatibacter riparius]UWZ83535.1 hypothetical protein MOP44_23580 [Occallatibacter riparius]